MIFLLQGRNKLSTRHLTVGRWILFFWHDPPHLVNIVGGIYIAGGTALYPQPNVNPGVPLELFGSRYPGGKIINAAAFSQPTAGQQGSFGRNVLRGFGATQADLALQRQFHLTEKVGLRFRTEFFNMLNHPNFGPPINSITSPLFGNSTSTLASSLGSGGANGVCYAKTPYCDFST